MKLFRQKDELFELMARGGERRRGNAVITTPSGIASPTPTTAKLPRPRSTAPTIAPTIATPTIAPPIATTPTTDAPTGGPTLSTITPKPPLNSTPSLRSLPLRPPPSLGPAPGATGAPSTTTPRTAPRAAPSLSTTTRRTGLRSPLLPGATPGGGDDDLFDLDGDALVVVDDGWEEASAMTPDKTFAIRADTAIVGSILAGSPGTTRSRTKIRMETPITTRSVERRRRRMYAMAAFCADGAGAAPRRAAPLGVSGA